MSTTKTSSFTFPHEKLTYIDGEPNNATLTILKRQIYANAMENKCTLGCGLLGYLGIIMPTAAYEAKQRQMSPTAAFKPFEEPIVVPPKGDDSTATEDTYYEDSRKLRDYNAMESMLKQQLLAAFDTTFISSIEDAEVGFGLVTSKEILALLISEYGTVTLDDLDRNTEVLNEPWNSEQPIRLLWDRIKECQRIASEGGDKITDKMAMYTALKLLDATGLYSSYTTNWRSTYPLQTTWNMNTFREFFNHADKDRKKSLTVKDAGYHGANATKSYKAAVETTAPSATTENTARTKENIVDPTTGRKIYYCWSHGGSTNPNHTSAKCTAPKDGHQKTATWFDRMEGCTELKFGKSTVTTKKE